MISAPHCYIFDIDGTIADLRHRLHHIQGDHKNWNAFFMAMRNDAPIWPVIDLMPKLKDEWTDILLVSGRPEDWREDTEEWLHRHRVRYDRLYMRLEGDKRSDVIVKREILQQIRSEGYEILMAFDDRPRVVEMWRAHGITTLQNEWKD